MLIFYQFMKSQMDVHDVNNAILNGREQFKFNLPIHIDCKAIMKGKAQLSNWRNFHSKIRL